MTDDRLAQINDSMHILTARLEGLMANVEGLESEVGSLADSLLVLIKRTSEMAETVGPMILASKVAEKGDRELPDHHIWVSEARGPDGDLQVLIERVGDRPPTVAFRRESHDVWGPPWPSEVRK